MGSPWIIVSAAGALAACGFEGGRGETLPGDAAVDAPSTFDMRDPTFEDAPVTMMPDGPPPMVDPLVIEAENFTTSVAVMQHEWRLATTTAGFTGTGYMQDLPSDGHPCTAVSGLSSCAAFLVFELTVTSPGGYYVHGRGFATGAGDDSFWLGIDAIPISSHDIDESLVTWQWKSTSTPTTLAPGVHAIHVWAREAGIQIDKVAIGRSPSPPIN